MHFDPGHIYHVYNRGNNKQKIFFREENYLFLLRKIRIEWADLCDIYSYCLMPNHFHFMLEPTPLGCEEINMQGRPTSLQNLSKVIGKTLSSYSQAINIQNKRIGTLFQKKTKAKCLTDLPANNSEFYVTDYLINCWHYIHSNPVAAKLVRSIGDWSHSSWKEYCEPCSDNLAKTEKFLQYSKLSMEELVGPYVLNERILERIW